MFKIIGSVTHEYWKPVLKEYPVVSTAMRIGALVTKALNTTTLALQTTGTAVSVWGVTNHAVASSATGKAIIALTPGGTIFEADVSEILNATTLTCGASTGTTEIRSTLAGLENDTLNNGYIKVIANAHNPAINGTLIKITDYANTNAVIHVASGTWAQNDTYQLVSLSNYDIAGAHGPYQDGTYADTIKLAATAGAASIFKVIGTNSDGTKLHLVLLNGIDSQEAVS